MTQFFNFQPWRNAIALPPPPSLGFPSGFLTLPAFDNDFFPGWNRWPDGDWEFNGDGNPVMDFLRQAQKGATTPPEPS
jgi:hypothetical protein